MGRILFHREPTVAEQLLSYKYTSLLPVKRLKIALAPALCFCLVVHSPALTQTKQSVRQPVRAASPLLYYESSPTQVIETFALMQQANGGNVSAQHELGYRYLVGRGLPADTQKAAEWILRSAERGMPLAQFNAAILYTHALGVPWNPFKAYAWFKKASEQTFASAEFFYGLQFLDGLVVQRDLARAYQLVSRAASAGHEQAKEVLADLRRRGIDTLSARDSRQQRSATDTTLGLVYLHFETVGNAGVSDSTLFHELQREMGNDAESSDHTPDSTSQSEELETLMKEASIGVPEAFTVLGRLHERGIGAYRDLIRAAMYYLRANRLESPRAPVLLYDLVHTDAFMRELTARSLAGDKDARYVWAALAAIEFDRLLGPAQALKLLEENVSANPPHAASLLELGVWYATGRNVQLDPDKAIALWRRASAAGLREADVRIAVAEVLLGRPDAANHVPVLQEEASKGSILAQTALGYCLENGIGFPMNKPGAVSSYMKAAQRGSLTAYNALKRMFDSLRPLDEEFIVD